MGWNLRLMDADLTCFAELGQRIERRWERAERDVECFAELAAEEIARVPRCLHVDAIVGSFLCADREAARQLAPPGTFGQPGLTLYYGRGFAIG